MIKKSALLFLALFTTMSASLTAQTKATKPVVNKKVTKNISIPLDYNIDQLDDGDRELLGILIDISQTIDEIYVYQQKGTTFYPTDMSTDEYNKLRNSEKSSPYTILRRTGEGGIEVVPYRIAYERFLKVVNPLLDEAIGVASNPELKKYLESRRNDIRTDNYSESDNIWTNINSSLLNVVFGPICNGDDAIYNNKKSYGACVSLLDKELSGRMDEYSKLLLEIQESLPVEEAFKTGKPNTNHSIQVANALYFAGKLNKGTKPTTIIIPTDSKARADNGTRHLILRNIIQYRFDHMLVPLANTLVNSGQVENINHDAFFLINSLREMAYAVGPQYTIDKKQSIDRALRNQYGIWEEAKADICGLYFIKYLIESSVINEIKLTDAYTTFMANLLLNAYQNAGDDRSKANTMCLNYMLKHNAIVKDNQGKYKINEKQMDEALIQWVDMVLRTESEGDINNAMSLSKEYGIIDPKTEADLKALTKIFIPYDFDFEQGRQVLGLGESKAKSLPQKSPVPVKINDKGPRLNP